MGMSEPCDHEPAAAALVRADSLEAQGDLLAALDALIEAADRRRDPSLERRLVRLRRAAFARLPRPPVAWPPPAWAGLEPAPPGGFEVSAAAFGTDALATGILRHGHVLVRGLLPAERVACLRNVVDRAFEHQRRVAEKGRTDESLPWYDPLEGVPDGDAHRLMVRAGDGVLAADSPRGLFELLATVRVLGLDRMIAEYFGERPTLSVRKCTLRRIHPLSWRLYASNWHQDGAFLGRGIRTVNAWFALSRCGRDAAGMQLIPLRLDRLLATGERGSSFDWTVSPRTIRRSLPGIPVWEPEFQPGDALFFDHWFLHRTALKLGQWRSRYAVECWFFASSLYADDPTTALLV
jgi:hypothetical protein